MNGKTMTTVVWHAPPKNRKFVYCSIEWMVRTMTAQSTSRANWINYYYVVCCPKLFRALNSFEKFVESVGASTSFVFLIRLMNIEPEIGLNTVAWRSIHMWRVGVSGNRNLIRRATSTTMESKDPNSQWVQLMVMRQHPSHVRGLFICSDINGNIISDLNVCQCFCSRIFYLTSARMENRCTLWKAEFCIYV